MSGYSDPKELLVGDTSFDANEAQRFVDGATAEIDSRLGFTYVLPLPEVLPPHMALLLQRTSNLIASGRFLLARATPGEDNSLHAYGLSLLQEGQGILTQIATGMIDLVGIERILTHSGSNAPEIFNADSCSGVDAFYLWMNTPATPRYPAVWVPGL